MRWQSGVVVGAALTMGATRLRRELLTALSPRMAVSSPSPAPAERSTSITGAGGHSLALEAASAAIAVASSAPAERQAARSAEGRPSRSRHDVAELLDGVAAALGHEAEEAADFEVGERLVWLMADLLEAADELEGRAYE